jgi:hypothetical protein
MRLRFAAEVVRVLLVAVLVELALRSSRLPRVAKLCGVRLDLTSAPLASGAPVILPAGSGRKLRAVDLVMSRWPLGDTCLRRCLVLGQRLHRLAPVLRIGVAFDASRSFVAHSWLEVGGQSLDAQLEEFAAFGSTG